MKTVSRQVRELPALATTTFLRLLIYSVSRTKLQHKCETVWFCLKWFHTLSPLHELRGVTAYLSTLKLSVS